MIVIREEQPDDIETIYAVNEAAFGRKAEADLVDALRRRGVVTLSLVAVDDGQVVGHILFSPVTIESDDGQSYEAVGLGPVAVEPARQNQGIGSLLINTGLDRLRKSGVGAVILLGHVHYYPRFGFVPSSRYNIHWEYNVPEEAFMALELREGALAGVSGTVRYQPEFAGV